MRCERLVRAQDATGAKERAGREREPGETEHKIMWSDLGRRLRGRRRRRPLLPRPRSALPILFLLVLVLFAVGFVLLLRRRLRDLSPP